jgi:hypothetical protein
LDRTYRIKASATPEALAKGYRKGELRIGTDAPHHSSIVIPVELSPDRKCVISPPSAFFGRVGRDAPSTRTCKLSSNGDLTIHEARTDGEGVSVRVAPIVEGHEYDIAVRLKAVSAGLMRGNVRLIVTLDGQKQELTIPWFALVD